MQSQRRSRRFEVGASNGPVKLFECWRETHLALFDLAGRAEQIETFDGKQELLSSSHFVLSKTACTGISFVRSPQLTKDRLLDQFGIRLIVAGSGVGAIGTRKFTAGAGDLLFFDLQQPLLFETSVEGGLTSELTLWVPRARLQTSVAEENLLHGHLLTGSTPGGAVLGSALRSFAAQADLITVDEMDGLAEGLVELAAKILGAKMGATRQSRITAPLASFVSIRRFIDRNLASRDLGVDMIARSFGLSRASLYRLFEPIGGVASYIRKQRLQRAFQEITAAGFSNTRIGPIAYRHGFKNGAIFSRAFRATYGIRPTQARSAAVPPALPRNVLSPAIDGKMGILARWLLETSNALPLPIGR